MKGDRWRLGAGLGLGLGCVTPFDALRLLWNLFSSWSICSAPVRGGTHFLCCCKESKQRKQLSNASPNPSSLALETEWFNRGSVVSGVSPLLACRKGAHLAPQQGVEQQSFIRHGTSCPTTGLPSGELKHAASTNVGCRYSDSDGRWFCLTGEREARGWMNDCWSTSYSGATRAPCLHANNDETPLTTLPRLDHSEGAVWRRLASIGGGKLLSLLTFFAAAKKVSPAPDRGRANKPIRIQVQWKPKNIKRCKHQTQTQAPAKGQPR